MAKNRGSKADQQLEEIRRLVNIYIQQRFTGQFIVKINMSQGGVGQVTYSQTWHK